MSKHNKAPNKPFFEFLADVSPYVIVGLVFLIAIASLISLVLVDIITGRITGEYISNRGSFGLLSSLAGTGMLIACGALVAKFYEDRSWIPLGVSLLVFLALQGADMYFDAISVDIMRFGKPVSVVLTMTDAEAVAHNIYRAFIAGISLVGEPLAVGSLVMFPQMKKWIMGMLKMGVTEKKFIPYKHKQFRSLNNQLFPQPDTDTPAMKQLRKNHDRTKPTIFE